MFCGFFRLDLVNISQMKLSDLILKRMNRSSPLEHEDFVEWLDQAIILETKIEQLQNELNDGRQIIVNNAKITPPIVINGRYTTYTYKPEG